MMVLRLASRNLMRNKKRTILTATALALGISVLIFAMSLLDGMDLQSFENFIAYDMAHVKGLPPGRQDEDFPGLDFRIDNASDFISQIENRPGVLAVAPRLEMNGMLYLRTEETFIRVMGIDPVKDSQVFKTLDAVVDGEPITNGEDAILIGFYLARDLGIEVGDIITVMVRSAPGALNPRQLTVKGIMACGHPDVDQFEAYVPLSVAYQMALLYDSATEIDILLEHESMCEPFRDSLASEFQSIEWHTWRELAADFLSISKAKRVAWLIMISIFAIMAAVGIANTMMMSVHERTREIGTLRAFGFSKSTVRSIFLLEGAILGLLASFAGMIIGSAFTLYLSVEGISLKAYEGMDIGVPLSDALYPALLPNTLLLSLLFGILMAVAASWGSATRASKGEIIKALREGML